jgi:TldD protein
MQEAASYARSIAKSGQTGSIKAWQNNKLAQNLYPNINPLHTFSENQKVDLLKQVDTLARSLDSRVTQVNVELSGSYNVMLLVGADGNLACDVQPLVRLSVSVLVEENGRKERGSSGGGGRNSYEIFLNDNLAKYYTREAVRIALVNLSAIHAPAGQSTVVLGSGWPAVMLHEAVGHGLEADFNRKKSSIYTGKIGQQVASPLVSIVDQGNLPDNRRGSINIDDEGTTTQRTVLIENGILCNYMYDKLNARLMHTVSTGNGRRASYAQIPLPRMTNTFMLPGKYDPREIIASVDNGIYAVNFSGGQVDITSGEFVFSTSEAYLIKNGKIADAIKGATLVGNGPIIMHKITMVGNDLAFDTDVGTCGKSGQNVPVGVGQPTIKISELTVGGTTT